MLCCSNKQTLTEISVDSYHEDLFPAHTIWPRQIGGGSALHSQLGTLDVEYINF